LRPTPARAKERNSKIEVVRSARSREPMCEPSELIGLATDLPLDLGVPRFALDDAAGICDLIEARAPRAAPAPALSAGV